MMVMVLEHGDRKVKHESYRDMIDMEMSTFEIAPMAVTIGGGVINKDCVITWWTRGMFIEVGVLGILIQS